MQESTAGECHHIGDTPFVASKCWKKERVMGRVELELRGIRCFADLIRASDAAYRTCVAAAAQMGLTVEFAGSNEVDEDILSEAIEAAEALGL